MERRGSAILTGGIVLLCSSLIATPLIRHDGLARGMDVVLHVGNVVECSYLLQAGKLPPFDWVPDVAGGRGGPNYLYYGTLGFLVPACLVNFGLSPEDAIRKVPDGECYETGVHPNDYRFRVNIRSVRPATFHQYFFEGWRAEVDGVPWPLQRDRSGLCGIEIPAGGHDVRLRFVRTPAHAAALVVSAAAWTAFVVTVAIAAVRRLGGFAVRGAQGDPAVTQEGSPSSARAEGSPGGGQGSR